MKRIEKLEANGIKLCAATSYISAEIARRKQMNRTVRNVVKKVLLCPSASYKL